MILLYIELIYWIIDDIKYLKFHLLPYFIFNYNFYS